MNSRSSFKPIVAFLTVLVFFVTSLGINPNAFAMPTGRQSAAIALPLGEVSLPYHAALDRDFAFALPSELGKLEYFKPGKGPMLVHVQTAHGNYEAQQQIRKILHHVANQYGIKTLLLEGSASELSSDFLNFFPKDRKLTEKIADVFTKHALVTGEELYLLDKNMEGGERKAEGVKAKTPSSILHPLSAPAVQAFGIENLASYLANGESFAAALREKQKTGQFLKTFDEGVRRLSAPYLSSDLRGFLDNLKSFESRIMGFHAWLSFLKEKARKHLRLDLGSPRHQLEWPMLLRVFKIQELGMKLDKQALMSERERFLKVIKRFIPSATRNAQRSTLEPNSLRVERSTLSAIESLLRNDSISVQLPDPETSLLVEDMVRQLPRDFNYDAFPNVRAFIGTLLLQSELKADGLRQEVEALSDRLAAKLAETAEEKALVDLFKDYRLLEKLFALELTPAEYERTLARKGVLLPSKLAGRFLEVNKSRRVRDISFEHLSEIDNLFEKSLKFYEGAKARDIEMMQGVERRLKETGADRAVIITGGFHADPFREHFSGSDHGYALISPRITSTDDKGKADYVQFVMNSFVKTSTYAMSMQGAVTDNHFFAEEASRAVGLIEQELRPKAEVLDIVHDALTNSRSESRLKKISRGQSQDSFNASRRSFLSGVGAWALSGAASSVFAGIFDSLEDEILASRLGYFERTSWLHSDRAPTQEDALTDLKAISNVHLGTFHPAVRRLLVRSHYGDGQDILVRALGTTGDSEAINVLRAVDSQFLTREKLERLSASDRAVALVGLRRVVAALGDVKKVDWALALLNDAKDAYGRPLNEAEFGEISATGNVQTMKLFINRYVEEVMKKRVMDDAGLNGFAPRYTKLVAEVRDPFDGATGSRQAGQDFNSMVYELGQASWIGRSESRGMALSSFLKEVADIRNALVAIREGKAEGFDRLGVGDQGYLRDTAKIWLELLHTDISKASFDGARRVLQTYAVLVREAQAFRPRGAESLGVVQGSLLRSESRAENAMAELKKAFDEGRDTAVLVTGRKPANLRLLGYDWDGVITREEGYLEKAWTALLALLLRETDDVDLDSITQAELEAGTAFRKATKGKEHAERYDALVAQARAAGKMVPERSDQWYFEKFWGIIFRLAEKDHGADLLGWRYQPAVDFVIAMREESPELQQVVISANPQEAIRSVVAKLGMTERFDAVHGHPLRSPEGRVINKTTILQGYMSQNHWEKEQVVFWGDSPSDIKFGKAAGVVTIGVANDYDGGAALIDAGADIVVTRLKKFPDLQRILGFEDLSSQANERTAVYDTDLAVIRALLRDARSNWDVTHNEIMLLEHDPKSQNPKFNEWKKLRALRSQEDFWYERIRDFEARLGAYEKKSGAQMRSESRMVLPEVGGAARRVSDYLNAHMTPKFRQAYRHGVRVVGSSVVLDRYDGQGVSFDLSPSADRDYELQMLAETSGTDLSRLKTLVRSESRELGVSNVASVFSNKGIHRRDFLKTFGVAAGFFEITPRSIAESPKWIALGLGAFGLGLCGYLAAIAIRHIVHKQKTHTPDESASEQPSAVAEDRSGTGNVTTREGATDLSVLRSESRSVLMVRLVMALVLSGTSVFSELTMAAEKSIPVSTEKALTPVPQILKDLQFGMNRKKTQAMEEIVKRLNPEEGKAPDVEILIKQDEIVKLLLAMVRNPFGGEMSAKAVAPLAEFAKRDPALVDLLVQELKKGTPTTKLQVIRTLAAVGAPAKDAATPDLKALLKDPKLGNDAAIALALFGGPFAPDDMSNIVRGMMRVNDLDAQLKIALKIIDSPGVGKSFSKELELVLMKGLSTSSVGQEITTREIVLRALAKIDTPNSLRAILSVLSLSKYSYQTRVVAVEILSKYNPPPEEVLKALIDTIQSDPNAPVLEAACKVLGGYGAAASGAVPVITAYLEKLPEKKNLSNGDKDKAFIASVMRNAIKRIQGAQTRQIPTTPLTNQVPQEVKRSESRVGDEDMSSDGPLDAAERAANEMDSAMALQMERSLGHVEVADVAGDPQAASDAMDQVMAEQLERFKEAEREARKQELSPRILVVDPGAKGTASSFVMAEARFLPIEKVWIETRDGRVLGYSPMTPGDFREALKKRFEERGIADDLSIIARVQLDMKSPFRSETRRDQPSPRREKWIHEHARVIAELEGLDRDRSKVVLEPATLERAERLNHLEEAYAALNWRRIQLEEYLHRSRLAISPVTSAAVALGTAAVKSPEFTTFVSAFILTAGLQSASARKVAVPFDPDDELTLIFGDIQKMAHRLSGLPLFRVGELFHRPADLEVTKMKRSESREHPFMREPQKIDEAQDGADIVGLIPQEKKPLHAQIQNPPLAGHLVNLSSPLASNFSTFNRPVLRSEAREIHYKSPLGFEIRVQMATAAVSGQAQYDEKGRVLFGYVSVPDQENIEVLFDPLALDVGEDPWVIHGTLTKEVETAVAELIAGSVVPDVTLSVRPPSGQRISVAPTSVSTVSSAYPRSENPITPAVAGAVRHAEPMLSTRGTPSENPVKSPVVLGQSAHPKIGKTEVPNGDFDFKDVMIRTMIEGIAVEKPLQHIESKELPQQIQLAVRAKVKTAGRVEHYSAAEHAIKVDRKAGWVVFSLSTAKDEPVTVLLSLKSNAGKVIAGDAVVATSKVNEAGSEKIEGLLKKWEEWQPTAEAAAAKAAAEKNKKILLGNGPIAKRQADKRTGGLIDKVIVSPNERERAKMAWQDLEDSSLGHLISSGLAADLLKILKSAKRIQALRSWGLGITLTVFAVAIATAGVLAGFMAPVTITLAVLASVVLLVEMGVFNAMKPEVLEMGPGNDVFLLIPLLERVLLDVEKNAGVITAKKSQEPGVVSAENAMLAKAYAEADEAFRKQKAKTGVVVANLSAKIAGVDPDLANGNGKSVSAVKPMNGVAGKPATGPIAAQGSKAAARSESRTGEWNSVSVEQRVGEILEEFTGRTLDPLDTLEELGMDSLDTNDLIATLEEAFGLFEESLRSKISDTDNQHTLAQSILEILEAEPVPSEFRQEKKVRVPAEATAEVLLTSERLVLIREYYDNLIPAWLLRKLLEKQVFPEVQAKLEAWLGMPVTEAAETEILQQLIPGGHRLLARPLPVDTTRADASSQISVNVRNVVTVGGSVAIESGLVERLLSENPRALFYLLKGFLGNTEGPALVTVGTPDLAKKIIREITAKRVVDVSEKESLDAITAALAEPTNKLLRIETLAEGETEATALNRFTAVNQGGVVSLHLNSAMLSGLRGGYHFVFAEEIGSEDLLVASVLGSALKSIADLIRNIPDEKLRGDLLTEFVQEHLPGVTKHGDVFVINQLAKLAEAFVQQALIAKSA